MSVIVSQIPGYQVLLIPKKAKGQFRTIYAPDPERKAALRALLPRLQMIADRHCGSCVHGFMPCRSPVTNAMAHQGRRFTLSFDLSDFFDSVGRQHLAGKIDEELLEQVLVDGAPRQGLPTSPTVANIGASDLDRAILDKIRAWEIVYTRYADDLTISFQFYETYLFLRRELPQLVEAAGFRVNWRKTRLQDAKYGRRIITGVAVGDDLKVPRAVRRKLRAALDRKWFRSAEGLKEWSKLRLPHKPIAHTVKVLAGIWQIRRGRQALTDYRQIHLWDSHIKAAKSLQTRDQIAAYIRHGIAQRQFSATDIKHVDQIVTGVNTPLTPAAPSAILPS